MSNSNVICRLCAEPRNSYMKLDDMDFDNKSLLHKVESIAPEIFAEDKNMPKDICTSCYMQLNQAYKFKNKCLESQVKLKMSNICSEQKLNPNIIDHNTAINNSADADPICVFEENVNDYLIVELNNSELSTEQEPNEETCLQENNNFETKVKSMSEIIQNIPEPSSILESMLNKSQDNAKQKRKLKSHTCDYCNKIFNGRQSLYAHICIQKLIKQENRLVELQNQQILNQNEEKLVCDKCNTVINSEVNLDYHVCLLNTNHVNETEVDSKPSSILKNLLKKGQQEKKLNDSITESKSTNNLSLDVSVSKNEINPDSYVTVTQPIKIQSANAAKEEIISKAYKCNHCNKLFKSEQYVILHLRALKSEKQKRHECEECGMRYRLKSHLENHILTHRYTGNYTCEICDKQFKTPSSLQLHVKRHAECKTYNCTYCDKKMISRYAMQCHIRTHTNENPYQCQDCDKSYKSQGDLTKHVRLHHTKDMETHMCEICGKCYNFKANLNRHVLTHRATGYFMCEFCGKQTKTSGEMKRHVRTHTNERPYSCQYCEKKYKTSHELTNHRRMHTNDRPFHCVVCGKKFTMSVFLKNHLRTHTLERPFKCDVCDKAFRQKYHLRQHKVVHTGVKAYACDICDKRFALKQNMQVHKRLHDMKPSINYQKENKTDSDTTDTIN